MRKKALVVGLAAVLSFWALAQSTGFRGIPEGFFGAVMSGLGQAMVPLSAQAPSSTLAACERDGIPTSLRVTRLGTTRSTFCPGQGEVRARAAQGGSWAVSVQGSPPRTGEVVRGIKVRSGEVTPVDVEYHDNPWIYQWEAWAEKYPVYEETLPECRVTHDREYRSGVGKTVPERLFLVHRFWGVCRFPCQQGEPDCQCQGNTCTRETTFVGAGGSFVTPTIVWQWRKYP